MPFSSADGKSHINWVMSRIPAPVTALDIGCGEGTYAKMFPDLKWTGVEIWEPYIDRYELRKLYAELHVADARKWEADKRYSVCFLGDVLEHMTQEEAVNLLNKAKLWADTVIVSIPIGHHPQGEWEGNPHERHVKDDWLDAEVKSAFGTPTWSHVEGEIGVYVYSIYPINPVPKKIHIVWIGDETKQPNDLIQTWRDKNPGWEVKVWGNDDFNNRDWINIEHMKAVWDTQIYGVADMMRYEILYEEGGFCIDADSVCEQPLDDFLFNKNIVLFYENEIQRPGLISVGYMASAPKNEFFRQVSKKIKNNSNIPNVAACMATGPFALTECVKEFAPDNMKIMPSHLFMPIHHTGEVYAGTEKVYGKQYWGSTGKDKNLKICVYAISKNEEQFVRRFCESAKDADLIVIADTGSTDGTANLARECGAVVHDIYISPWRFDLARNAALALIPRDIDICISLDLDEVLEPHWRQRIEAVWNPGKTTNLWYYFDWGHGIKFPYRKIHSRHGYHWHHPCHEDLRIDGRVEEVRAWCPHLLVSHHPDPTKSRGQYMDILRVAVQEDDKDPHHFFYYARELTFYSRWEEAKVALQKYLDMNALSAQNERCYAMRLMGKCYAETGDTPTAEKWFYMAAGEAPNTREPWYELAMIMYRQHRWEECFAASMRGLKIKDKALVYTCDPIVWGWALHDLAAISAHKLGLTQIAIEQGKIALEMAPDDLRLKKNLEYYRAAVESRGEEAA